jgi:transcriptional regulator with XRE-family HTH domain
MRAARGLSQARLAAICKLDRTYISLMERGLRQPTLTTIFAIGKALRMPPGDIVGLTERQQRNAGRRATPIHRL